MKASKPLYGALGAAAALANCDWPTALARMRVLVNGRKVSKCQKSENADLIEAALAAIKNRDWSNAITCLQPFLERQEDISKDVKKLLDRVQRGIEIEKTLSENRLLFQALADPEKIIWPRCHDIRYKVTPAFDISASAGDILSGDWDTKKNLLEKTVKFRSIKRRYLCGIPWENTELFADNYRKRFARGEVVRGARSIAELKRQYEERVDMMYYDLQQKGFVVARDEFGFAANVPHVHIARDGTILYGTRGNHRLAMAYVLRLAHFPCQVRARHLEWQRFREKLALVPPDRRPVEIPAEYAQHPDLADLLSPEPPDRKSI